MLEVVVHTLIGGKCPGDGRSAACTLHEKQMALTAGIACHRSQGSP